MQNQMKNIKKHYCICWYMTYQCNLECSYCYAFKKKDNFDFDNFLAVGSELIKQGVSKINLAGGEPFASKFLLNVVDEFHTKLNFSITTNGTVGSEEDLKFLKGKIDCLAVSVDTIDNELGRGLKGKTYNIDKMLDFITRAIEMNFELKINTVVSKHNISYLNEIGDWLSKFNKQILWRLFQVTNNPNVQNNINDILVNDTDLEKTAKKLAAKYPLLTVKKVTSHELNHNYVIITPEGNIQVPYLNSYKSIGNILNENMNEVLEKSENLFLKNQINNPQINSLQV